MLSDLTTFKNPLWIKSEGLVWVPVSWFLLSDTQIQKLWHAIVSLLCVSIRVEVLLSRWPSCVDPAYQLDPGLGGTLCGL